MLRKRKNKRYNEETHDDKDGGGRTYNLKEKIRSPRFEQLRDLQILPGEKVSLKLVQKNGFDKPILVETPAGLDLRVPSKSFVVRDVGKLVGHDRRIDVMDVRTQKNIEMTMKEWCKYYESRQRDRLLNVISLEFSHTDLDSLVESPKIVRHLDWVDLVWPKFLKESQTESTNSIEKMKYPKVQKYCLMSVKGSYTDFHIDFAGTSVWYHILRGKKMFWMCPPTELNLQAFEEWTLSGMQQAVFFGDTVEECFRVELSAGNTFFIPSGWIHAVYTAEDSLVFGGNFLHSFGIENQLKVLRIEDATKVPLKFRYPFYTEILWYVVQHYVYCLTGKSHLHPHSNTTTPEKSSQKARESKRVEVVKAGDTTESEQDESDSKHKPMPKKRGRPTKAAAAAAKAAAAATKRAKKAPPTDDESTEIDSDLEEVKPSKSAATCRMTKNSLLRLQYEIDDSNERNPQPAKKVPEESTSDKNSKAAKKSPKKSRTPDVADKSESEPVEADSTVATAERNRVDLSQMILSLDARSNSRPANPAGSHQLVWSTRESEPKGPPKIHITKYEVNGLRLLVKHLSKLSGTKKHMPALIRNSRALLDDCKKVIAEHENDDPELAATDVPIGPELLSPKKSDINQLIDLFFKPAEANSNDANSKLDSPNSVKTKFDSSTLTHQQRLKYMQSVSDPKIGEKNSNQTSTDSVARGNSSPNKDVKNLSPSKKSTVTLPPSLAAVAANTTSTSADQPRPKSPPTRPLSNKQYTSKTKKDNSLALPGSFADLIAATSTAKEVFDVSSAEVTSSLFGLKSSSPNKAKVKDGASVADAAPSESQADHDSGAQSNAPNTASKPSPTKPNSPEPPKMPAVARRVMNPALSRPQNKEKLVFASAPYVSPSHNMDHSKSPYLYPWQSPAIHHPQQATNSQKYSNQHLNQSGSQAASNHSRQESPSTTNPDLTKRSPSVKQEPVHKQVMDKMDVSICPVNSHHNNSRPAKEKDVKACSSMDKRETSGEFSSSRTVSLPAKKHVDNSPPVDQKSSPNASSATVASKQNPSFTIDRLMAPSDDSDNKPSEPERAKKAHKPRGPPKKSKEARQVLEADTVIQPPRPPPPPSQPQVSPSVPVIVTARSPVVTLAATPSSTQAAVDAQPLVDKSKPKAKRPKKQKDGVSQAKEPAANQPTSTPNQTRPPVICGLVAPSMTQATRASITTPQSKMNPQQYLISRPLLFNSMPTFCTNPLQQQMPQPSVPIFTTPVPTSMGLPGMQPGARIVWATRPPTTSTASTTSASNSTLATQSTSQANPKASSPKPTVPQKPSDHAALLSLATTALSTAPLPTTPTLSHIGARAPTVSQTLMVNPLVTGQPTMFAGQQFFNPFLSRMPMFGQPQLILGGAPNQTMASVQPKPAAARPTGQLLFAPLPGQSGQPRYLITQPGFLPHRPQTSQLFTTNPTPTTLAFAAYRPPGAAAATAADTTRGESVKVKKVKTR